jgi:hypothetical protein
MILNKSQPSCPIFSKPLLSLKNAETCQEYASPQNGVRHRAHLTEALKALAQKFAAKMPPIKALATRFGYWFAELMVSLNLNVFGRSK